jgi:hypothetical protein
MRLPRIRFTVRRMMLLVLLLALTSHLGVTAWKVRYRSPGHVHTGIMNDVDFPGRFFFAGQKQAFWPSFWRQSLGLSLKDLRTCRVGGKSVADVCELDNPAIAVRGKDGSISFVSTPGQDEVYVRLLREKGRTVTVKDGKIWISMDKPKPVK